SRLTPPPPQLDVSNASGPQNEVTLVVDPLRPDVLLATSNSFSERSTRVYSSTDGGRTWTSSVDPHLPPRCTGGTDPVAGIGPAGWQYVGLVELCPGRRAAVAVSSRQGPSAPWSAPVLVAPPQGGTGQDKDALAVDTSPASPNRGRVYVAWTD